MFKRLLRFVRGAQDEPGSPHIVIEAGGFAMCPPSGPAVVVPWASVTQVAAYKRDNFTTDEVCVAFDVSPGMFQEVSEEWPGFQELLAALETALSISPAWYSDIIHPAFASNYRILYPVSPGRLGRDAASAC